MYTLHLPEVVQSATIHPPVDRGRDGPTSIRMMYVLCIYHSIVVQVDATKGRLKEAGESPLR